MSDKRVVTRLAMVSDLHGKVLPDVNPCDVFIIAGDICPDNRFTIRDPWMCAEQQARWCREVFIPYLERQLAQARHIIFIWGNHDFLGEFPDLWPEWPEGVICLHDSGVVLDGVRFYGCPWVNVPGNRWALDRSEVHNRVAYEAIDLLTNVLITHGPPKLILDRVAEGDCVGSSGIRRERDLILPAVHVFGHIHEARGMTPVFGGMCYNVSAVTERYVPVPDPIVYTTVSIGVGDER